MNTEKLTEYFEFLDELLVSGEINMYGARPYLVRSFPELGVNRGAEAGIVLSKWMQTFDPDMTAFDRAQQAIA